MDLRFLQRDKKLGPNLLAHVTSIEGFKDIMAPIVVNHENNCVTFFFDEKNSFSDNNIEMLSEFFTTAIVRREVKGLRSEEAQELEELALRVREIMRIARKRETTRPSHNTYKTASV